MSFQLISFLFQINLTHTALKVHTVELNSKKPLTNGSSISQYAERKCTGKQPTIVYSAHYQYLARLSLLQASRQGGEKEMLKGAWVAHILHCITYLFVQFSPKIGGKFKNEKERKVAHPTPIFKQERTRTNLSLYAA